MTRHRLASALACLAIALPAAAASPSPADIIKQSKPADWRPLDPQNTVVMEVNGSPVVFELAPRFAPRHAANVRKLVQGGYFSGLAVIRVQDNFVAQWGDPNEESEDKSKLRPLGAAEAKLPAEFSIPYQGLPIARLSGADGYAPVTGFVDGLPVAADPKRNRAWIPHCYGVIGAGRGDTVDSSNGSSLYAIIGQSPRALDLNITVVGRVLKGMEALSSLPRGGGAMGFYDKPEQNVPLGKVRLLADIPPAERPAFEVMRTDTATWRALAEARRHASGDWYVHSAEHVNVCNVSVPTRPLAQPAS
ncbi:peptidylprolyl isomerase [Chitinimonas koreensis]|uniref:peptidylprolyl isomerase n=1 Tax=Chitinimonas koreensis TaxID=356302 RepID=UPI0003F6EA13|nr:peptidylprolyl isomerase [Chitinimonas koreensis]QNM97593.1 peptidylprolyl isomerase [Chitinimonas koreensis]